MLKPVNIFMLFVLLVDAFLVGYWYGLHSHYVLVVKGSDDFLYQNAFTNIGAVGFSGHPKKAEEKKVEPGATTDAGSKRDEETDESKKEPVTAASEETEKSDSEAAETDAAKSDGDTGSDAATESDSEATESADPASEATEPDAGNESTKPEDKAEPNSEATKSIKKTTKSKPGAKTQADSQTNSEE